MSIYIVTLKSKATHIVQYFERVCAHRRHVPVDVALDYGYLGRLDFHNLVVTVVTPW